MPSDERDGWPHASQRPCHNAPITDAMGMDIISSTVHATSPRSATIVDRQVVISVFGFSVAQARLDAVQRFTRESAHPEAKVSAVAVACIVWPTSGRAWTNPGTYHVTLLVTGEVNLAPSAE